MAAPFAIIPANYPIHLSKQAWAGIRALAYHWDVRYLNARLDYQMKGIESIEDALEHLVDPETELGDRYKSLLEEMRGDPEIDGSDGRFGEMKDEIDDILPLRQAALDEAVGDSNPNKTARALRRNKYLPRYTIIPNLPPWVLALQKWFDVHRDAHMWAQGWNLGEHFPKRTTGGRRFYDEVDVLPVFLSFKAEWDFLSSMAADFQTEALGWDKHICAAAGLKVDGRKLADADWDIDSVLLEQGVDKAKMHELLEQYLNTEQDKEMKDVDEQDDEDSDVLPGEDSIPNVSGPGSTFANTSGPLVNAGQGPSVIAAPVASGSGIVVPAARVASALVAAPVGPPLTAVAIAPYNPSPAMPVGSTPAMVADAIALRNILTEHAYNDIKRAMVCFGRAHYQPLPQRPAAWQIIHAGTTSHWPKRRGNPPLGLAADRWDRDYNDAHSRLSNYAKAQISAGRIPIRNGTMTPSAICNRAAQKGYLRDIAICLAIERGWILHDFSLTNPTHTYNDSQYNVHNAHYN
ncbi:hypothetical protein VTL71DRAFT_11162 [Oculimacula yallundae]|uniref:Uncharacterized protein n=1 Tax=Oculimacula yallundae TaxID=86028 RepID=A0ABR4CWL2_9HELO